MTTWRLAEPTAGSNAREGCEDWTRNRTALEFIDTCPARPGNSKKTGGMFWYTVTVDDGLPCDRGFQPGPVIRSSQRPIPSRISAVLNQQAFEQLLPVLGSKAVSMRHQPPGKADM
ncbi:hypothetical protein ASG92_25375 [Arthrobacter sp. Soil736]|uniref:hypothetical protein n=1 Tax=Arthrobacter sp. Soil736 TaxID=1736395 RepID=UPI0006FB5366|nr:hypothetical protein [Arthrobacter sp. Soil736]KRE52385.1 hypothetical protein ASG92_25375 [Arthrobacter sp. Soil736]